MIFDDMPAQRADVGQAGLLRLFQIRQHGRRREDRRIIVGKAKSAGGLRLPLPLDLLEKKMNGWLATRTSAAAKVPLPATKTRLDQAVSR